LYKRKELSPFTFLKYFYTNLKSESKTIFQGQIRHLKLSKKRFTECLFSIKIFKKSMICLERTFLLNSFLRNSNYKKSTMKWSSIRISCFFYIFQRFKLLYLVTRTLFLYLFFFQLYLFYISLTLNFMKKKKKVEQNKKQKNTKERKLKDKFITKQNCSEYNCTWKNFLKKYFFLVYFVPLNWLNFYIAVIYKRKLLYCLLFNKKKILQFFFKKFFKKNSINWYKKHLTNFCKRKKISNSKHGRGLSGVQLDLGLNSFTFEQDDILPTFSIKYYNTFQYSENRQNFKVKKKKTQRLILNKKLKFLFVYRLTALVVLFSILPIEDTHQVFLCNPFKKFANSVYFTKYLIVQHIFNKNILFVRLYNPNFFLVFFSLLFFNRIDQRFFFFIKELSKNHKMLSNKLKNKNWEFFRILVVDDFYIYILNKIFFLFQYFYSYEKKKHTSKFKNYSFINKVTLAISQRQPFFSKIQNYGTKSRQAFYQFFYRIDKKMIDNQIFDLTFFQTFFSNIFIYDLRFYNQKFLAFFQKIMWHRYKSHYFPFYIISNNMINLSLKYG